MYDQAARIPAKGTRRLVMDEIKGQHLHPTMFDQILLRKAQAGKILRDGSGLLDQASQEVLAFLPVRPLPPDGTRTLLEMGQVIVFHQSFDHGQMGGSPLLQKLAQAEIQILQLVTDAAPSPLIPIIPEGLEKIE